jgi:tetratricopeptide (TPR) repeat protein
MRKIFPFLIAVIAAIAVLAAGRFAFSRLFQKVPPTADIPAPTPEFRSAYKAEEGIPDWDEIRRTRTVLISALMARNFALLDSILSDAQKTFERNPACEPRLVWLYRAFASPHPAWEEPLTQWVEAKGPAYPALTARSVYFDECGWDSRGGAVVGETSRDQLRGMERYQQWAIRDARAAAAIRPKSIVAFITLIRISKNGTWKDRMACASEAYRVNPVSFQATYAYMVSLLPRWGGSYAAVKSFSKKTRAVAALNPELRRLDGMVEWDRGRILYGADSNQAALKAYDKALQAGAWWEVHRDRGRVLKEMDREDEAFESFTAAAEIRPLAFDPRLERALILFSRNQWPEAEAEFELARATDPYESSVRKFGSRVAKVVTYLAYEDAGKGDHIAAIRKYDLAIAKDSTHAQAYKYRAASWIERGDLVTALDDMKKAVKADPHYLEAYQGIDWILAHKQDWKSIVGYWDEFLALEPENATGYFERSGTYFHLGDMQAAKRDGEKACELGNLEACKTIESHF